MRGEQRAAPPPSPTTPLLIRGARQIVTMRGALRARRGAEMSQIGVLNAAAMLVENGRISQLGLASRVESLHAARKAQEIDASGCIVLPGLVDCHTHMLFPGPRLSDYVQRIAGSTYEEIAQAGGGILSTMRAVRSSTVNSLQAALDRSARLMLRHGTMLAEVKSGYGMSLAAELKMLRAVSRSKTPLRLVATCLGAHALPPECEGNHERFMSEVCRSLLPEAARLRLAEFADIYCDRGAFSVQHAAPYLEAAAQQGFGLRVHASQFANIGAVELAVRMGAVSADHLEAIEPKQVELLARSDTIATLLPASVLHLGLSRYAPARALIDGGAAVALATDFNPGSSPTPSLPLVMSLACAQMRMTPAEALTAVTVNAAAALRRTATAGVLEAGRAADFTIFAAHDYREIPYYLGGDLLKAAYRGGREIYRQGESR